ncbi:MAG: acylglycerol kinase family protein [Acetobacteraceae bacterium]
MIVIFNPAAGRRRANSLWRVLDVLSANGMRLELAETRRAGHATELAREAAAGGARLVVAAGGDGTIAEGRQRPGRQRGPARRDPARHRERAGP